MTTYVLTAAGYRPKNHPKADAARPEKVEVERAKKHLQEFWIPSKAKTFNSYYLKHQVERTHDGYCSNGSLIQAARDLGFDFKPDGSDINVEIFVKENRPVWKAFEEQYPHGRKRVIAVPSAATASRRRTNTWKASASSTRRSGTR